MKKDKSLLFTATQQTHFSPKEATDHSQFNRFFFFTPKLTVLKESLRSFMHYQVCCKKQPSTLFLKEWSKITGQKVTSAQLFWMKSVLLNQVLFLLFLMGSLTYINFNIQNLNASHCSSLPKHSEHHSQPDSHLKSLTGIQQSNASAASLDNSTCTKKSFAPLISGFK